VPCVPNPCPQPHGACCHPDGTCTITIQTECLPPNVWHPEWLTCEPNPCPQPQGACCLANGECIVTTAADCALHQGVYQGNGTTCEPTNPCPPPVPTERSTWGQIKNHYR
jgi:hypothetical protein